MKSIPASAALRLIALPVAVLLAGGLLGCAAPLPPAHGAPPPPSPERVSDYRGLMATVEAGRVVRVVIHYRRCLLRADGKEAPGPDAVGGMDLGTFEAFAPMVFRNPTAFLAASEAKLISHARYGVVYNYVKLRVHDDGRAEIVAQYLDPRTFEVKMDELFACHLGTEGGVELVPLR